MEYIPGGDIFTLLQNVGSLSEENARTYTVQIVKALQFLRDNGIIHRDIKPDNILITAQGNIKLADFGLSYFGVQKQPIRAASLIKPRSVIRRPKPCGSVTLTQLKEMALTPAIKDKSTPSLPRIFDSNHELLFVESSEISTSSAAMTQHKRSSSISISPSPSPPPLWPTDNSKKVDLNDTTEESSDVINSRELQSLPNSNLHVDQNLQPKVTAPKTTEPFTSNATNPLLNQLSTLLIPPNSFYDNKPPLPPQKGDDDTQSGVSNNVVGTPDYMAPEIILSKSHTYTADYWSLGVVVFEMLTGIPPFHGTDEDDTFRRILTGAACWEELDEAEVSDTVKDFIKKLLTVNPKQRLGSKSVKQIMRHPWFDGIDWDHVESLPPVFVPDTSRLDNYKDYFSDRYNFNEKNEIDIIEDMQLSVEENEGKLISNQKEPGAIRVSSASSLPIQSMPFSLFAESETVNRTNCSSNNLNRSETTTHHLEEHTVHVNKTFTEKHTVHAKAHFAKHEMDDDDDLSSFPTISFEHLKDTNVQIANRLRQEKRRASEVYRAKDNLLPLTTPNIRESTSHTQVSLPQSPLCPEKNNGDKSGFLSG